MGASGHIYSFSLRSSLMTAWEVVVRTGSEQGE